MDDLDELYRIMLAWERQKPGLSKEERAKLYYNQRKELMPRMDKGPSHEDLFDFYNGKLPGYSINKEGYRIPAYDTMPRRQNAMPEQQNTSPMKSLYDMLQQQLGPMQKGVETGGYGPSIDPRIARKFVM